MSEPVMSVPDALERYRTATATVKQVGDDIDALDARRDELMTQYEAAGKEAEAAEKALLDAAAQPDGVQ